MDVPGNAMRERTEGRAGIWIELGKKESEGAFQAFRGDFTLKFAFRIFFLPQTFSERCLCCGKSSHQCAM